MQSSFLCLSTSSVVFQSLFYFFFFFSLIGVCVYPVDLSASFCRFVCGFFPLSLVLFVRTSVGRWALF